MISKLKMLNGYIKNDLKTGNGDLFKAWLKAANCYDFDQSWLETSPEEELRDEEVCFICEELGVDGHRGIGIFKRNYPFKIELTLADFEEVEEECIEPSSVIFAPENKQPVSKYKYAPIEVESIFELKEPLERGKLFYGKPDNMKKILHEWGLMKVIVEDEFRIHLQEEVRWQEQISEEFNFTYVEKEDSFVQTGSNSSEDMIKFCKRVLELSGE